MGKKNPQVAGEKQRPTMGEDRPPIPDLELLIWIEDLSRLESLLSTTASWDEGRLTVNGVPLETDKEDFRRPFLDLADGLRKNIDKAWCLIGQSVGHCITRQQFHELPDGRILRGSVAPNLANGRPIKKTGAGRVAHSRQNGGGK